MTINYWYSCTTFFIFRFEKTCSATIIMNIIWKSIICFILNVIYIIFFFGLETFIFLKIAYFISISISKTTTYLRSFINNFIIISTYITEFLTRYFLIIFLKILSGTELKFSGFILSAGRILGTLIVWGPIPNFFSRCSACINKPTKSYYIRLVTK